jgi:hypothetical protein
MNIQKRLIKANQINISSISSVEASSGALPLPGWADSFSPGKSSAFSANCQRPGEYRLPLTLR